MKMSLILGIIVIVRITRILSIDYSCSLLIKDEKACQTENLLCVCVYIRIYTYTHLSYSGEKKRGLNAV